MKVFGNNVTDRIAMAPDNGAGSGAPESAAPAPAQAAPSTPAPADAAPAASPNADIVNDIRSKMQEAAEAIRSRNTPPEHREKTGTPLPGELVGNAASKQIESAMQQPTGTVDTTSTPKQEEAKSAEQQIKQVDQSAQMPAAIRLEKFGREFSMSEIETAIEAANYYHPKVLEIQASAQRLAAEEQRIASLKDAPEMVLIEALKNNDFLRSKVTELFDQLDPDTLNGYKQTATNIAKSEEVQKLESRLAALEQERQQFIQQEQQRQIQAHDAAVRGSVEKYVTETRAKLAQEGIQITDADLCAYAKAAMADVMQKQLAYDPQAVTQYFAKLIENEANKQRSIRKGAAEAHTQRRSTLPPPPPTGGGAPVLRPNSPKDFTEAKGFMADRLRAALSGIHER